MVNDSKVVLLSGSRFDEVKASGSGGGSGGVGGDGVEGMGGGEGGCGLLSGRKVARSGCQTRFELLFDVKRSNSSSMAAIRRPKPLFVAESENANWPATRLRSDGRHR